MKLTFDEIRHEYRYEGQIAPSVTQVLAEVMNWSAVPEDLLEHGRRRGTAIHALTQADDEGDLEAWQVGEELLPYMQAYRKFKAEAKPNWQGVEERVFHKLHRYAGTLDRRGDLWEGLEYAYIDIKTGDDHPVYDLQLSAYVEAAEPRKREPNRYVLLLNADGSYKLSKRKTKHRDDFAVFLSLLTASRWKEKNRV